MDKKLQDIANDVFKRYPNENTVHVTADGQAFFDKSHALNHSRKNRTGKELKLESFQREHEVSTKDETMKTVKELSEIIKTANAEEVAAIISAEEAMGNEARKSVFTAAEKRLKELNSNDQ